MLECLKFVMGAVSRKELVPGMTHFKIEGGFVRGYNGMLALCSPIPVALNCAPNAAMLVKAIQNCEEAVHMTMTPAGRLSLRSGPFRALIECLDGETPHVEPEGAVIKIPGKAMLSAFRTLAPFMGDDASRPWSNGILLWGSSAFATCNVIAVEYHHGAEFPAINIPRKAVVEILRIGEVPERAQCTDTSLTLHYSGGRWLRTQLLDTAWPDLQRVLDAPADLHPLPDGLFDALRAVQPFTDALGAVYFTGDSLRTSIAEDMGAAHDVVGLPAAGVFSLPMLLKLEGTATEIDWSQYPRPCLFRGEHLRGALVGLRI